MTKNPSGLYTRRMLLVFTTYTAFLIGVNVIDGAYDLPQSVRIGLSLLPVLPAIAMIGVILAFVRTMDEVWQRIMSESTLVSAGIVGIGTFTLGFLEGVITLPSDLLIWILPAMIGIQGVAMTFVKRRYA